MRSPSQLMLEGDKTTLIKKKMERRDRPYHQTDHHHPQPRPLLKQFDRLQFVHFFLQTIIFCFPSRCHKQRCDNHVGCCQEKGLTGHMLKLMGNIFAARQEAFLTLMEREGVGVLGGRLDHGSLVPKLLWSFSSLHCHPEPLLAPLSLSSFFPFTALHHPSQAFPFVCLPDPPIPKLLTYQSSTPLSLLLSFLFPSLSQLFLKCCLTKCSLVCLCSIPWTCLSPAPQIFLQ